MSRNLRAALSLAFAATMPMAAQQQIAYLSDLAPALKMQGNYTSSTTYNKNDVVVVGSTLYYSLQGSNTGNAPASTPSYWALFTGAATGQALNYLGAYSGGTTYSVNAVVTFGGSSWISLQANNTGNTPASGSNSWGLLAAQGSPGQTGQAGQPGTPGQAGAAGPQGNSGTLLYPSHAYTSTSYGNEYTTVGTAPAIDAVGHLQFNSTAGSVTGQQAVLNSVVTNSENWVMKAAFVLGTVGAPTNSTTQAAGYGLVLAAKSVNPNAAQGMLLNYSTTGAALSITTFSGNNQGSGNLASVAIPTPAVNDTITLISARRGATMYGLAQNSRTGAVTTVTWTDPLLGTTGNSILPNTSQFAILDYGGTYTMLNLGIQETSSSSPGLCILGDSKSDGVGSGGMGARWGNLLDQYGPVDVFAGGGDGTAQVLAAFPVLVAKNCKTLALAAPWYNDLGWGTITVSQSQANYSSVVAKAKAAGMKVVHMLTVPISASSPSASSLSSYNSWVSSTFSGDTIVDPSVNFNTSTMLIGDGIHPNYLGYSVVAADFITQAGLTAQSNPVTYQVPSPLALYGQP